MIKGKGGVVRCPFSVKLCSRITVFSKQMLKNQVLEIFLEKIFGGLEKRLYLCIIKQ